MRGVRAWCLLACAAAFTRAAEPAAEAVPVEMLFGMKWFALSPEMAEDFRGIAGPPIFNHPAPMQAAHGVERQYMNDFPRFSRIHTAAEAEALYVWHDEHIPMESIFDSVVLLRTDTEYRARRERQLLQTPARFPDGTPEWSAGAVIPGWEPPAAKLLLMEEAWLPLWRMQGGWSVASTLSRDARSALLRIRFDEETAHSSFPNDLAREGGDGVVAMRMPQPVRVKQQIELDARLATGEVLAVGYLPPLLTEFHRYTAMPEEIGERVYCAMFSLRILDPGNPEDMRAREEYMEQQRREHEAREREMERRKEDAAKEQTTPPPVFDDPLETEVF